MSLLDDARKMVEVGPFDDGAYGEYYRHCIYCGAEPDELPPTIYGYKGHPSQPHKSDCPWLSMPKIVAALEALGYYASADNYEAGYEWPILVDGGSLARRALEA